jgi:hypothetical protein
VLRYAWSIRLMLLAGLFSGLEIALPLFHDVFPLDQGVFAALSFVSVAAAFVTRLLAQQKVWEREP